MKYSEFKKSVEGLSKHYHVYVDHGVSSVSYKGYALLDIASHQFAVVKITTYHGGRAHHFNDALPYARKLWMLANEFSMTPFEERKDNWWNVIIGPGSDYCAYTKSNVYGEFWLGPNADRYRELRTKKYTFSDSEFEELMVWLKKMPDGDHMAKIAELGKVLAPEAD